MDCFETKQDFINKDNADITFQGWDIQNSVKIIKEEIEDHLEQNISNLKIIESKEIAFSCSRFSEGTDARDEGHSHWLDYKQNWRKGLGKCTVFKVKYNCSN